MDTKIAQRFIVAGVIGYVIFGIFRFSISVVLPDIQKQFVLNETEAGALMSLLLLASLVTMNLTSHLSNRIGRKYVMTFGLFSSSLGMLLLGLANSYHISLIAAFLSGLGVGFISPSIYGLVGEMAPKSRGFLAGLINAFYGSIGGFLGPLLSGIMISQYDWRFPLCIFGAFSFLTVASFWFLSKDLSLGRTSKANDEISYVKMLRSKHILAACASVFAAYFGFTVFATWTPSFLFRERGFDPIQTGTIYGTWVFMSGIGAVVLGWLSDKHDRRLVIFVPALVNTFVAFIFYSYVMAFIPAVIFSIPFGFASGAFWSLGISLVQDAVDPLAIVSATALVQSIGLLGGIAGPVVSAALFDFMGLTGALITCVSISYFMHGMLILPARKPKQQVTNNIDG